ncbi:hypothetical protein H920_13204 [Fukomys damarensis]|uniref:Uncharacterized protein n=1 Tax=Fukomys damarensis TaxID=885580 RepID=A0A091D4K8_FUKDA|nr:hypothetical protein H920_13204 [Fukomys damarensis]
MPRRDTKACQRRPSAPQFQLLTVRTAASLDDVGEKQPYTRALPVVGTVRVTPVQGLPATQRDPVQMGQAHGLHSSCPMGSELSRQPALEVSCADLLLLLSEGQKPVLCRKEGKKGWE